jgi:hypothetical protein
MAAGRTCFKVEKKRKEKKREHCVWNWIIKFQRLYTSSITAEHTSYTYNVSSNLCTHSAITEQGKELQAEAREKMAMFH